MGLDLVVEGCPKPGHEAEWREILARSFGDGEPIDSDASRFGEISIPPHERVGAPRVGFDLMQIAGLSRRAGRKRQRRWQPH